MKKSTLINILLILVSATLTLGLSEYVFRKLLFGENPGFDFLRSPDLYALNYHDGNENFFNEDYWKLNYLFGKGFELDVPQPLLGWTSFFDKKTMEHTAADKTGTKRNVLLFGDSFAMCVESVDCFEDILNNDSLFNKKHQLVNYGVGGYGLDQIYLLFREAVLLYKKPFVIFSFLTTDLDRSVLKVRDAQKPYFELKADEIELKGTPITMSSEEFFARNPPEIRSYLWNMLVNKTMHDLILRESARQHYVEHIKTLNEKILIKAFDNLKSLNTDYVVLIFQPTWHAANDWRLEFVKRVCAEQNVPFILDPELKTQAVIDSGFDTQNLFIPNDGHPTTLANRITANEIKRCVLDSGYISTLFRDKTTIDNSLQKELREKFRMDILNSEDWTENVKQKAKERGISLDSMISLDVDYLIGQQTEVSE